MKKGYVLVEGHGEVLAAGNLVNRVSQDLGAGVVWSPPLRWNNIHQRRGLEKGIEFIRRKGDAGALLFLRDEDDACPKEKGPEMARIVASLAPSCPTAVVLLHPEFEVLFLPCWVVASATSVVNCTGRVCIEHELLRVRCITTTMPASETSVVPLSRTTTALPVLPPPPQDVSERDQVNSATASGILI